jgi:phenylalanyl-tRNA synthetase beta chain
MRQTLLPGLLNSIRHNFNHGIRDVSLFELGRVFGSNEAGTLPVERECFALVATGGMMEANRAQAIRELDFLDLKGAVEAAIYAMNLPPLNFEAATIKHLRPGQSASISADGARVGSIGCLADSISSDYKFRQPVFVAELDLTTLLEMKAQPVLYAPLPRFPSIVRDVSLLVDRSVSVAELSKAATDQSAPHFVGVTFVGTYEGEGIPDHQRSVTLRFEYRAGDRTMRDEEVDAIHWPLVEALKEKFSAEVR